MIKFSHSRLVTKTAIALLHSALACGALGQAFNLKLSASSIRGGASATGTVTLNTGTAPTGGNSD
ncbi:MAG TPA: hypothetical protein VGL56_04135 [Fimbriimonadaceae bacterium]|jgi:hypothetical protein